MICNTSKITKNYAPIQEPIKYTFKGLTCYCNGNDYGKVVFYDNKRIFVKNIYGEIKIFFY